MTRAPVSFYQRPAFWGCVCVTLTFVLDQLSKWFLLAHVMNPPRNIPITSFFDIVMAFNRGVSFSLFSQDTRTGVLVLCAVALVIVVVLSYWMLRAPTKLLSLALGLMIGGALGNMLDRLRIGAVVDFLYFHWENHGFPAFNVADTAITIGVGLVLLDSFLEGRSHAK